MLAVKCIKVNMLGELQGENLFPKQTHTGIVWKTGTTEFLTEYKIFS